MLRAVGLPFNLLFAALARALIREEVREIERWIALVFFLVLVVPFAAGFLVDAAAPALAFFAAGFFAVESARAVSAAAPPAAIHTTGQSSTLSSAIVRTLVLFPKRLAPKDIAAASSAPSGRESSPHYDSKPPLPSRVRPAPPRTTPDTRDRIHSQPELPHAL
jgi:hypothetical protein